MWHVGSPIGRCLLELECSGPLGPAWWLAEQLHEEVTLGSEGLPGGLGPNGALGVYGVIECRRPSRQSKALSDRSEPPSGSLKPCGNIGPHGQGPTGPHGATKHHLQRCEGHYGRKPDEVICGRGPLMLMHGRGPDYALSMFFQGESYQSEPPQRWGL
jgi:hypothetical protein